MSKATNGISTIFEACQKGDKPVSGMPESVKTRAILKSECGLNSSYGVDVNPNISSYYTSSQCVKYQDLVKVLPVNPPSSGGLSQGYYSINISFIISGEQSFGQSSSYEIHYPGGDVSGLLQIQQSVSILSYITTSLTDSFRVWCAYLEDTTGHDVYNGYLYLLLDNWSPGIVNLEINNRTCYYTINLEEIDQLMKDSGFKPADFGGSGTQEDPYQIYIRFHFSVL